MAAAAVLRMGPSGQAAATVHRCWTRTAGWALGRKARKARLQMALRSLGEFCRRHPAEQAPVTLCELRAMNATMADAQANESDVWTGAPRRLR